MAFICSLYLIEIGKKIRVNNAGEAATLEKLGALPIRMEIIRIAAAISSRPFGRL